MCSANTPLLPSSENDTTAEFQDLFNQLMSSTNIIDDAKNFIIFFQRNKERINRHEIDRIIWRELPLFCFRQQIQDSTIPSEVLRCIHELPQRNIPNIVVFLIISSSKFTTLNEDVILMRSAEGLKTFNYLSYFLHHSKEARTMYGGNRITDSLLGTDPSPFINVVVFSDPRCVLTLVQYGVRFHRDEREENGTPHPIFTYSLEFLIYYGIHTRHFTDPDLVLLIPAAAFNRDVMNTRDVFRILLRSTYNPYGITFKLAGTISRTGRRSIPDINTLRVFYEAIYPGFMFGYPQASPLKRICRSVIRKQLDVAWKLPEGIYELGLPQRLVGYVNLEED